MSVLSRRWQKTQIDRGTDFDSRALSICLFALVMIRFYHSPSLLSTTPSFFFFCRVDKKSLPATITYREKRFFLLFLSHSLHVWRNIYLFHNKVTAKKVLYFLVKYTGDRRKRKICIKCCMLKYTKVQVLPRHSFHLRNWHRPPKICPTPCLPEILLSASPTSTMPCVIFYKNNPIRSLCFLYFFLNLNDYSMLLADIRA